jgi:hypothetical protein
MREGGGIVKLAEVPCVGEATRDESLRYSVGDWSQTLG